MIAVVEDGLFGIFALFEVVAIVLFWVAAKYFVVNRTIGGVDPAAEGTSVNVGS